MWEAKEHFYFWSQNAFMIFFQIKCCLFSIQYFCNTYLVEKVSSLSYL